MLLRVDWKAADAADLVQWRTHRTLHFIDVLTERAKALGANRGTIFQALLAQHNAELQRKRDAEEARLAALEVADGAAPSAAPDEGLARAALDEAASRANLNRGDTEPSSSADAVILPPVLQPLAPSEIEDLGAAGAELRGLLRIKVEDDQDLKTAQQALAECGYFLLLLREEAPARGLTHAQLLKKCELGEA